MSLSYYTKSFVGNTNWWGRQLPLCLNSSYCPGLTTIKTIAKLYEINRHIVTP